jgi:hypothetical protein
LIVCAEASSTVAGLLASKCAANSFTRFWNASFFATKSVSEFTSKITALLPSATTYVKPSAAIRSPFFKGLS